VLVVDVGGTHIRAGTDDIRPTVTYPTPKTTVALLRLVVEVAAAAPPGPMGVACPGVVDETGRVLISFLPPVHGVDLAATLASRTGRKVVAMNDVDVQGTGAAEPGLTVAYFGFGTRVGGSVMTGLQGGRRPMYAGEFGHLSCGISSTTLCECGASDCLDLAVAGFRLEESYGEWWTDSPLIDRVATERMPFLARALRSVTVVAGPDRVVLGGTLMSHEPLRSTLLERVGESVWRRAPISFCTDTWPLFYRGFARIFQSEPFL